MTHMIIVPPSELAQWEVEIGIAGMIDQLRNACGEAQRLESAAQVQREVEAELRAGIHAYRQQLGLPDAEIPMPGSAGDPPGRVGERLRHAVLADHPAHTQSPGSRQQGKGND